MTIANSAPSARIRKPRQGVSGVAAEGKTDLRHPGAAEPHLWGAAEVKVRLKEAAGVLRAAQLTCRDRPARLMAHWPDVVRDSLEAYGYQAPARRVPRPTPAAVSRADEAVPWLLWLDAGARRIVWARASGVPWRKLEDMDGRSHTTLRKVEAAGLDAICRELNRPLAPDAAVRAAFRQGRRVGEKKSK